MSSLNLHLEYLDDDDDSWVIERKMFDSLNEYLQENSTFASAAIARIVNALTPWNRQSKEFSDEEETPETFLMDTWDLFLELIKQIPYTHSSQDKMVQLIKEMKSLQPYHLYISGVNLGVWQDLPLLDVVSSEAWIPPTEKSHTSESMTQWVNFNSFGARLLGSEICDWTEFAVWELRRALESPINDPDLRHCYVQAAVEWIKHSGSVLFRRSSHHSLDEEERRSMRGGPLYSGEPGVTPERWHYWKQQFQRIGEDTTSQSKEGCILAVSLMEEIECANTAVDSGQEMAAELLGKAGGSDGAEKILEHNAGAIELARSAETESSDRG